MPPQAMPAQDHQNPQTMYKLVLIRHGESTWNLENRFTGWTDVDLTATGIEQAKQALLRGVSVSYVTPEELGGAKDIAEAWQRGTLRLA